MTFAIFIVLVLGLFIGLLNTLPDVSSLPIDGANAIGHVIAFMKTWDFLLPIHELLVLVGVVLTFELAVWFWHISIRVVKMIRGHSDGS